MYSRDKNCPCAACRPNTNGQVYYDTGTKLPMGHRVGEPIEPVRQFYPLPDHPAYPPHSPSFAQQLREQQAKADEVRMRAELEKLVGGGPMLLMPPEKWSKPTLPGRSGVEEAELRKHPEYEPGIPTYAEWKQGKPVHLDDSGLVDLNKLDEIMAGKRTAAADADSIATINSSGQMTVNEGVYWRKSYFALETELGLMRERDLTCPTCQRVFAKVRMPPVAKCEVVCPGCVMEGRA